MHSQVFDDGLGLAELLLAGLVLVIVLFRPGALHAAGRRPARCMRRNQKSEISDANQRQHTHFAALALPEAAALALPEAAALALPEAAVGPAAVGPAAVGPAADGPAADGPAAFGPAAVGPAAFGPAAFGVAADDAAAFGLHAAAHLTSAFAGHRAGRHRQLHLPTHFAGVAALALPAAGCCCCFLTVSQRAAISG